MENKKIYKNLRVIQLNIFVILSLTSCDNSKSLSERDICNQGFNWYYENIEYGKIELGEFPDKTYVVKYRGMNPSIPINNWALLPEGDIREIGKEMSMVNQETGDGILKVNDLMQGINYYCKSKFNINTFLTEISRSKG